MNSAFEKPDKIVVVVHGVGDPEPGATISRFARSLASEDEPLEESQNIVWLSEKSNSATVQTFPAHQRMLKIEGQSLELCESFWADLSRVRRGWPGVIQGIFQIIFGLRYVAYVGADQPGPAGHWLKRLGLLSSKILHGPVLAVTFYLALLMIAVCGTQMMWPESYKTPIWQQIVLVGCSIFAVAAAATGRRLTRSRVLMRFWYWVNITTMFVTGLMLLKLFWLDRLHPEIIPDCPGLLWYCRMLLVFLGFLWFAEIQVLFAMAACWFCALSHPRAYRPALHVAFLVPALAVGIWGQAIPLLWVGARQGLSLITKVPEFAAIFDDAIPFLGVQLMMVVIVVVAAAMVAIRYLIWRKGATIEKFNNGSRPPRLIVNGWLQVVVAACTAVGVSLVSVLEIIQATRTSETQLPVFQLLAEVNYYAISVLVPVGGLLIVLIPKLRPALDMLLDVINHFYFRPTDMNDALDDDDEFDIGETTFENGKLFFARRDALHQRFKRILAHYRDTYTHLPDLVIVSHSQGTMVAIEVLNDEEIAWINNAFGSVSLVTMGSPFSHVYQHYFGHLYPALSQPYWTSLKRRIDNWTNICRIDDFVGTQIDFPTVENRTESIFSSQPSYSQSFHKPIQYCNHPVGPRGHTNYWSDSEVLEELKACLINQQSEVHRKAG